MAKPFITDTYLLTTPAAERLYFDYAQKMPLFDYHSHLPIKEILDNVNFENITKIWLYGDHYKWRAMWACGYDHRYTSGIPEKASDWERFEAWADTVSQALGNPLYHWTHLELKRFFDIDEQLSPKTAKAIYEAANKKLVTPEFTTQSLINRSNVKYICTTDDPGDDLACHIALAKEKWGCEVYPAWRPDRGLNAFDAPFVNAWLDNLEQVSGKKIATYTDMLDVLWDRHQFFHSVGCRLSDYGIERPYAAPYTQSEVDAAFKKLRGGQPLAGPELEKYRSALLYDFLCMDAKQDWTQQLHIGAKRNTNSKGYQLRGLDKGYDIMNDLVFCDPLISLLDRLESEGKLTRTILYVLNPRDDEMIASTLGSFQANSQGIKGKMQYGTAWWHNDHIPGMTKQLTALASIGVLSTFVGMETDSRSFLSYPRHELFRRVLCRLLGQWMQDGELPQDYEAVGQMVENICYNNAYNYFKFGK